VKSPSPRSQGSPFDKRGIFHDKILHMKTYDKVGLAVPTIILPKDTNNLDKWAVVACDQFTSEKEYWEEADKFIGDEPSTLRLIYPEVYLEEDNKEERIQKINQTMQEYLDKGIVEEKFEGFVYVERTLNPPAGGGKVRKGLVVALDLEKYDFHKGAKTLIRATEKTVEERIPPRVAIRENALIELPHIMVLIDDQNDIIMKGARSAPLQKPLQKIYDFDLMLGGGHIRGYKIDDEKTIQQIAEGLEGLIKDDFLYAMGDGNHSLATAKACYEADPNELNRYALVELVNIHDEALEFEAIHRVVFDAPANILEMISGPPAGGGEEIEIIKNGEKENIRIKNMGSNLAVGNLQILLDSIPNLKIDYVHGEESVKKLSAGNNIGFILPVMTKDQLFPTVAQDGALPRKTFSMGEAEEKRYYLEARRIKP